MAVSSGYGEMATGEFLFWGLMVKLKTPLRGHTYTGRGQRKGDRMTYKRQLVNHTPSPPPTPLSVSLCICVCLCVLVTPMRTKLIPRRISRIITKFNAIPSLPQDHVTSLSFTPCVLYLQLFGKTVSPPHLLREIQKDISVTPCCLISWEESAAPKLLEAAHTCQEAPPCKLDFSFCSPCHCPLSVWGYGNISIGRKRKTRFSLWSMMGFAHVFFDVRLHFRRQRGWAPGWFISAERGGYWFFFIYM